MRNVVSYIVVVVNRGGAVMRPHAVPGFSHVYTRRTREGVRYFVRLRTDEGDDEMLPAPAGWTLERTVAAREWVYSELAKGTIVRDLSVLDGAGETVPTLDQLCEELLEELEELAGREDRTVAHLRMTLAPWRRSFGSRPVGEREIDFRLVRAVWVGFVRAEDRAQNNQTLNRWLSSLRRVLEVARERGFRTTNPAKAITPLRRERRRPRTLLPVENLRVFFAELYRIDREDEAAGRYRGHYPYFWLQATLARRGGELLTLRREDVDVHAGRIRFREVKTRKGEEALELPLSEAQRVAILAHLGRLRVTGTAAQWRSGLLFPQLNGRPYTETQTRTKKAWSRACEAAGIPHGRATPGGFTPHDLRRLGATLLNRITHRDVAKAITDHRTEEAHELYALASVDEVREAVDSLTHAIASLTTHTHGDDES